MGLIWKDGDIVKVLCTVMKRVLFLVIVVMPWQLLGADQLPSKRNALLQLISPGVSLNQQIASSSLNSSATSNGMFMITAPGRYFLTTDLCAAPCTSAVPVIYINASDVTLDLGGKSVTLSATNNTPCKSGIAIASGKRNITIMNGVVSGTNNGTSEESRMSYGIYATSNTNITLENVQTVSCKKVGIYLNGCKNTCIKNVKSYGNSSAEMRAGDPSFSAGLALISCIDGEITDSEFCGSYGTGAMGACGIYAGSSTYNFFLTNVDVSLNQSTNGSSAGVPTGGLVLYSGCSGFVCKNVKASANSGSQLASTSQPVAGIYLASSSNNNKFENCAANDNSGTATAAATGMSVNGIRLVGSSGNIFRNCVASRNVGTASAVGSTFSVGGIVLSSSPKSNAFYDCMISNNGGSHVYAYGFFSTSSAGTIIKKCRVDGNYTDDGYTRGIYLGSDTSSFIQECATNNNTSATSYAYGIHLVSCTNCTVEYNKMYANKGAAQYGFCDGSEDCTTFLRGNVSFGHGKVFNGGASTLTDTAAMNYFLTYAETGDTMNIQMLIKEGDIANMNAFEAGSSEWFNFSILEGAISG